MIITITDGYEKGTLLLGCKGDDRFAKAWGEVFRSSNGRLISDMRDIASWCNNELDEECLFEVD